MRDPIDVMAYEVIDDGMRFTTVAVERVPNIGGAITIDGEQMRVSGVSQIYDQDSGRTTAYVQYKRPSDQE